MASPLAATLLLYSRLETPMLLEHETRRSMVDRVRDMPGATVTELADALHVHYKTAAHHARLLSRAGHVVAVKDGRATRYYAPGAARPAAPTPRMVRALAALDAGATTAAALGRALGIRRGSAWALLLAMRRRGLAARTDGRWERSSRDAALAKPWPRSRCAP